MERIYAASAMLPFWWVLVVAGLFAWFIIVVFMPRPAGGGGGFGTILITLLFGGAVGVTFMWVVMNLRYV